MPKVRVEVGTNAVKARRGRELAGRLMLGKPFFPGFTCLLGLENEPCMAGFAFAKSFVFDDAGGCEAIASRLMLRIPKKGKLVAAMMARTRGAVSGGCRSSRARRVYGTPGLRGGGVMGGIAVGNTELQDLSCDEIGNLCREWARAG